MPTPDDDLAPQIVLVTGAGGPAGISVLRALQRAGPRVVAADASPDAVGLRLADASGVLPFADDPGFTTELCALAEALGATAVISTIAEELLVLAASSAELDAVGVRHWLPDPVAAAICIDKWQFHETATSLGVPVAASALGTSQGVPGPWIVKARFGRGSRDVHPADDHADVACALARVADPIVQHRLDGDEFTVDALVSVGGGTLLAAVPRWRRETRGGISVMGETFADDRLTSAVAGLLTGIGLSGPSNVQGFIGPGNAPPVFTEVNPRFAGGLPLSLAAGADIVGEYLRGIMGAPVRPARLTFRPGVRMYRFFEELFEEPVIR